MCQWQSNYQPVERGRGNSYNPSNGGFSSYKPNNFRVGQPTSLSVIGNTADGIVASGGDVVVNSIVSGPPRPGARSEVVVNSIKSPNLSGGSYNIIGNRASNIYSGSPNSVYRNP